MDNTHDNEGPVSINRREFLRSFLKLGGRAGLAGGAIAGLAKLSAHREPPTGARAEWGMLRPPGSLDEEEFLAKCIRCTRCSDVCEPQCIRLFGPEAGTVHQGTPYIQPTLNACTMCLQCGPACPTGAILPLPKREEIDMGVAVVDTRTCVSHNGTGICGACHTACPLRGKAITQNYRNAPEVHPEHCTGCGLCEEACIVVDRDHVRAIQVKTERVWQEGARS